jgi:hypothetical protein
LQKYTLPRARAAARQEAADLVTWIDGIHRENHLLHATEMKKIECGTVGNCRSLFRSSHQFKPVSIKWFANA